MARWLGALLDRLIDARPRYLLLLAILLAYAVDGTWGAVLGDCTRCALP